VFYDPSRVFQTIHLPLFAIRNTLSCIEAVFHKTRLNACRRKYVLISQRTVHVWHTCIRIALVRSYNRRNEFSVENLKCFFRTSSKGTVKWSQDSFFSKETHFLINCSFVLLFSHEVSPSPSHIAKMTAAKYCPYWIQIWICKVRVRQKSSRFFFLFIYIWFDRAWRAGLEYIVFISVRSLFGWKKP